MYFQTWMAFFCGTQKKILKNVFTAFVYIILKIKVPKGGFHNQDTFSVPKWIFFSEEFLKEPFFLILKNILLIQTTFSVIKDHLWNVKGSSWNHRCQWRMMLSKKTLAHLFQCKDKKNKTIKTSFKIPSFVIHWRKSYGLEQPEGECMKSEEFRFLGELSL